MCSNYKDFLTVYGLKYNQVKSILEYLQTYPELLAKFKIDPFIKPEALDTRQQDWVRIVNKYDGLEKEFFKPYWVPVSEDSFDIFIDLSDDELPIFEMEFFFFKPYQYFRIFLFYKISDLLLATEQEVDIEEFENQKLASIFSQTDVYFEMRKRLGLE